eukprot:9387464-Alexandrium_andersonii.AAC.1
MHGARARGVTGQSLAGFYNFCVLRVEHPSKGAGSPPLGLRLPVHLDAERAGGLEGSLLEPVL